MLRWCWKAVFFWFGACVYVCCSMSCCYIRHAMWLLYMLATTFALLVTVELSLQTVPVSQLSPDLSTHWGEVTHTCVGKLTIIGSDNGLLPGRCQAIIWTNARILFIGPLGTNFNEILIGIQTFSFTKMHLKISSAKWRLFCLSLNVLKCVM